MARFEPSREAAEYYASIRGMDEAQEPVLRPANSHRTPYNENFQLVDYITYKCPVRKYRVFALEDNEGRYWCGTQFKVGGWVYYNHEKGDEDNTYSYIFDDRSLAKVAPRLLFLLNDKDCYQALTDNLHNEPLLQTVQHPSIVYKLAIYNYAAIRAEMIFQFDREWGQGAYFNTQRVARAKHVMLRSVKNYQARRRERNKDSAKPVDAEI